MFCSLACKNSACQRRDLQFSISNLNKLRSVHFTRTRAKRQRGRMGCASMRVPFAVPELEILETFECCAHASDRIVGGTGGERLSQNYDPSTGDGSRHSKWTVRSCAVNIWTAVQLPFQITGYWHAIRRTVNCLTTVLPRNAASACLPLEPSVIRVKCRMCQRVKMRHMGAIAEWPECAFDITSIDVIPVAAVSFIRKFDGLLWRSFLVSRTSALDS